MDTNEESQETGAAFNSKIEDATIPGSPGVGSEPQEPGDAPLTTTNPLSGDLDPIRSYEEGSDFLKAAPLMPGDPNSPSSGADAGLDFGLPGDAPGASDLGDLSGVADDESFALESPNLDENLDSPLVSEIPMGNLDVESIDEAPEQASTLMSPSLDAPDTPGEVDIEALGDNAIEELLPPDARLDPIEE